MRGALFVLLVLGAAKAGAIDFSLKLEPGIAIPLTAPQSVVYGVGVGQSVKALFGLTDFLDVGPAASFLLLPATAANGESGIAWGLGAGLRLKRPHDAVTFLGISPWLDADGLYVRTGDLNRPGFDAAVGFSVPIGEDRTFWLGPFVRYQHVMQIDRPGFDNRDAKILLVGVSFEVGSGLPRPVVEPVTREVVREVVKEVVVTKEVVKEVCKDTDGDTLPDTIDRCPEAIGTMESFGCPAYEKLVVQKDKLELKEKLYFEWNEAKLEAASFPVLDEVVKALGDNKGFKVQVQGHTDSTGGDPRNQELSEQRASAVLEYLASHGVARERLLSKGFGSSVPVDTNATEQGRENNRRVEFVVSFIILNPESAK